MFCFFSFLSFVFVEGTLTGAAALSGLGLLRFVQLDVNHWREKNVKEAS